ncbi:gamma-glutamyl-gamma-aminobutyrate hydrolase family protein [Natranaerobius trueperi]|uniref:Uncharacterized protein n=1 Tax=Natranaerobius trueperi TaxID=759412 RepID=A0A226C334_9FIRM|nr:gamma-glutamyl-gamma-aminobutyrate hydrolase family protein [Natranaerobius trueperi]OWZ84869.1 hypothetical protein CDO51_00225 [Natranaerobius trueperi]
MSVPIIGVTAYHDYETFSTKIKHTNTKCIEDSGAIPVVLPNPSEGLLKNLDKLDHLIEKLDGILLTGGEDPDPYFFNEEPKEGQGKIEPGRDELELYLIKKAIEKTIPILAICRGMQIVNIALGGTCYQDLKEKTDMKHKQSAPTNYATHNINIESNSLLKDICNKSSVRVNSFHHQGIKDLASGVIATAYSQDGLVEAIEYNGFILGVQWHPETLGDHLAGKHLIDYFIKELVNK